MGSVYPLHFKHRHVFSVCRDVFPLHKLYPVQASCDFNSSLSHVVEEKVGTELILVELKQTPRVVRVASTHAYISVSPTGTKNYFAEAYAAINTRGNRIYWGSNWGQTDLTQIETFVAELPEQWPTLIP